MQFMTIYRTKEKNTPPTQEEMARMGAFIEEYAKAGVLIATGGLMPSATGAKVVDFAQYPGALPNTETYVKLMDALVSRLAAALK